MKKMKLPLYTFPLSIELLNKHGVSTVMNLLISSAQSVAHLCRVAVAIGEPRNEEERELGAGLRKILAEMIAPKKKAKRAASKSARKHKHTR